MEIYIPGSIKQKKISYILSSAIIFGLGGGLFIFSSMMIEVAIGSPSSTSSLIILGVIPCFFAGTFVGITFGVLYILLGLFIKLDIFHLSISKFTFMVGILVLLVSFCVPLFFQIQWNINNRPRVIVDERKLSDKTLSMIRHEVEKFKNLIEEEKRRNVTYKYDSKYDISYDFHSVTIGFLKSNKRMTFNFKGHDYIRDVKYFAFLNDQDNEECLLIYLMLRSTSRNIIYSVYDSRGRCIYKKLEKR